MVEKLKVVWRIALKMEILPVLNVSKKKKKRWRKDKTNVRPKTKSYALAINHRKGFFHAINFKYLYAVGLLIPHTRASSDTFIFPSRKAA